MKKSLYSILLLLLSVTTLRPSGFTQTVIKNCKGVDSEYIQLWSYDTTKLFVSRYRDNFMSNWEIHTKAIYLNNKTFLFLNDFFKANTRYKGINVHFAIYKSNLANGQFDADQFVFYFTPTNDDGYNKKKSNYEILRTFYNTADPSKYPLNTINQATLCPGNCDSSSRDWGYNAPGGFIKRLTDVGGGTDKILIGDKDNFKDYKRNYKKKTRVLFFRNDKHSLSIYISKDKIERIASFINEGNNATKFPAIGIYFASYDNRWLPHQAHKNQIVIGFVPMVRLGIYLEPDPCSYIEYVKKMYPELLKLKIVGGSKVSAMAENHGELCPDDCPEGEN